MSTNTENHVELMSEIDRLQKQLAEYQRLKEISDALHLQGAQKIDELIAEKTSLKEQLAEAQSAIDELEVLTADIRPDGDNLGHAGTLKERVEAGVDAVRRLAELSKPSAAFVAMRETLQATSDNVPRFEHFFDRPSGPHKGYDVWLHDLIGEALDLANQEHPEK